MDKKTLNRLRALAQGATFGFGDEVSSGLSALMAGAAGHNVSDAYNDIIKDARSDYRSYGKDSPIESTLLELAGGIPTGLGVTGALDKLFKGNKALQGTTLRRAATEGGLTGGAYGVGSGEGSLGDRLKEGMVQAGQGAVLSPLIVGGVRTAGNVGRAIKDATVGANNPKTAAKLLKEAIENDGMTLPQFRDTARTHDANFPPGTDPSKLYEHGGINTDSLMAASARPAGKAPMQYSAEAERVHNTAPQSVIDALEEHILHPMSNVDRTATAFKTLENLKAARKAQADPLYEKAFSGGNPLYDQDIQHVFQRLKNDPDVFSMALDEGARKKIPKTYAMDVSDSPIPNKLLVGTTVDPKTGQTLYQHIVPDLEFADLVKQSLYKKASKEGTPSLHDIRVQLRDALDSHPLVPAEYKQARGIYEEGSDLMNAVKKGADFDQIKNTDELAALTKGMTQAEKDHFLHGLLDSARGKIEGSAKGGVEGVHKLTEWLSAPRQQANLSALLDPDQYAALINNVKSNATKLDKADLMTPSVASRMDTTGNTQANLQNTGAVANLMSGISPGSLLNSVSRALFAHNYANTPDLAAELSKLYLSPAVHAIPSIEKITAKGPLEQVGESIMRRIPTAVGEAAGLEPPRYVDE